MNESTAENSIFCNDENAYYHWKPDANLDAFLQGFVSRDKVLEVLKRVDNLPFIGLDLRFSDDVWDFSSLNKTPTAGTRKFVFHHGSAYCDLVKMYVLYEILRRHAKIKTIRLNYTAIQRFLTYAEDAGFLRLEYIPPSVYDQYFTQLKISYPHFCETKRLLLTFIKFYEASFGIHIDKNIKNYLMRIDHKKLSAALEARKLDEIPPVFLENIRRACLSILDSPDEKNDAKITAAAILIIMEIGMRVSEFCGLSSSALYEVSSTKYGCQLYYLQYDIYKTASGDNGRKTQQTYANEIAVKAYNALLELCAPYRKKQASDVLFVTKNMKNKFYSPNRLTVRVKCFFIEHYKELGCLNTKDEYPEVPAYPVYLFFGPTGYGRYRENHPLYSELDMNDAISIPTLHQYRVSVCTNLIRKGVNPFWVQKYMGHVTPDMTDAYVRAEKESGKARAEKVYAALVEDGTKLMGTGADEFMESFRQYVDALDINIRKNNDELFRLIEEKYPLRPKLGGVCIRNGEILDCSSSDDTDEIYCAYGMCPFSCHLFFDADVTYGEYLRCKKMIEHNKANEFIKMAQKETNKLKYIVTNRLLPELNELQREVQEKGAEVVKTKYPQIANIVDNFDAIYQEVNTWL